MIRSPLTTSSTCRTLLGSYQHHQPTAFSSCCSSSFGVGSTTTASCSTTTVAPCGVGASVFSAMRHKRIYTTGMEHDPTFGPEAKRKEMLARGIKLPPQGMRMPTPETKRQDTRFMRKAKDFRELEDNDPYASLFGERRSFVRSKSGAWRKQFEDENENVELPYERKGVISRSAPNWFVVWMIGLRENNGADFMYLGLAFGTVFIIVMLWMNATVVPFGHEKDIRDLK